MVRILVVEDDPKLNQIVCASLGDQGYQAKSCLSAHDAYDEMYNALKSTKLPSPNPSAMSMPTSPSSL